MVSNIVARNAREQDIPALTDFNVAMAVYSKLGMIEREYRIYEEILLE